MGVHLEVTGTYRNAGYKDLVVEIKDGKLMADRYDRCFPFELTFEHLTGTRFAVELHDIWGDEARRMRGEVRIENSVPVSLGVGFVEEATDRLI